MTVHIAVFCVVTLYSLVGGNQRFGGTCCLHLHSRQSEYADCFGISNIHANSLDRKTRYLKDLQTLNFHDSIRPMSQYSYILLNPLKHEVHIKIYTYSVFTSSYTDQSDKPGYETNRCLFIKS
jgi:hypothetical protein